MKLKSTDVILVVEDDREEMRKIVEGIAFEFELSDEELERVVLKAYAIMTALDYFKTHQGNIVGIGLDGCLNKNGVYDSDSFLYWLRVTAKYTGPIVTISSSRDLREVMMKGGCSHEAHKKFHLGAVLLRALSEEPSK